MSKEMHVNKRGLVIALLLATFLAAIEGTVVTTATPTIVRDLQGFELISLVFSVYLLASAISTPICGKLADLYGRTKVLSNGIIIFLVGSVLCGLSRNIYMLIAFRAIQGFGAGSIFTVTFTIIGDIFALEERSKVQGGISTVWGIASLAGPFLGGILIDTLSWHWIFFINVPFGLLSIIILRKALKEKANKIKHNIDFAGVIVLSAIMIIFLNIFSESSNSRGSLFIVGSVVMTLLLLMLFYKIERKAKEPIVPFDIFTLTSVIVNSIGFLTSAILICIDVYMPVYIQNILGYNATISGLALLPMSLSWLMASFSLGKYIVKYGGKVVTLIFSFVLLGGTLLLPLLGVNSQLFFVILFVFILGFGFGGIFTTLTIIVQESVQYNKRGAAVAANSLFRTLGQTIGIGIFGSIFNLFITKYFVRIGMEGVHPGNLYNPSVSNEFLSSDLIKLSLNSSMHVIFYILISVACLSLVLCAIMPKLGPNVHSDSSLSNCQEGA